MIVLNSIVLPVHNEGHILLKTLKSLSEAALFAANDDIELVIVRDNADERTKSVADYYDYSAFRSVNIIDVNFESVGLARNAGVRAAGGDFIFFLDGDDLVSYNYFAEMITVRDKENDKKKIYFPELYCEFGCLEQIVRFYGSDTISPLMMFSRHVWGSTIAAYRESLLKVPVQDIPISSGYAYEDYNHNLDLLAHGYKFKIVPNTVMFYRKRQGSGVYALSQSLSVDIPPASLYYRPDTYVKLCRADYIKYKFGNAIKLPASETARERALELAVLFKKAHIIEPLINEKGIFNKVRDTVHLDLKGALSYFEICDCIKNSNFEHVFLIPYLAKGGTERYILNIAIEIYRRNPLIRILVLCGQEYSRQVAFEDIPPNVTFIDLGSIGLSYNLHLNCLLTLRIIETASSETAMIHLVECPYSNLLLKLYKSVLRHRFFVFYYFCRDVGENGRIDSGNFERLAANKDICSMLISDNKSEVRSLIETQGEAVSGLCSKLKVLYAPCDIIRDAKEYKVTNEIAGLYWASRLTLHKRMNLLPFLGKNLAKMDTEMSVYGYSAFGQSDVDKLNFITGLKYCGGFNGIASISSSVFDIFIYTSYIDGMPNAILEAIAAGLLVIAPDVGGIGEMIKNGETGILLPSLDSDEAMAKSYIKAIKQVYKDPQMRRKLVLNAQRLLKEQHSEKYFSEQARKLFSIKSEIREN